MHSVVLFDQATQIYTLKTAAGSAKFYRKLEIRLDHETKRLMKEVRWENGYSVLWSGSTLRTVRVWLKQAIKRLYFVTVIQGYRHFYRWLCELVSNFSCPWIPRWTSTVDVGGSMYLSTYQSYPYLQHPVKLTCHSFIRSMTTANVQFSRVDFYLQLTHL